MPTLTQDEVSSFLDLWFRRRPTEFAEFFETNKGVGAKMVTALFFDDVNRWWAWFRVIRPLSIRTEKKGTVKATATTFEGQVEQLVARDATVRRNKKVTELLLDGWWAASPDTFTAFFREGISGDELLLILEEQFPDLSARIFSQNRARITAILQVDPESLQQPARPFES